MSKTLPAGKWAIDATVLIYNAGGFVGCYVSSLADSAHDVEADATVDASHYVTLPAETVYDFPNGGTVTWNCNGPTPTTSFGHMYLRATQVAALH